MARDFLLEIGTEELPASACRAVLDLQPERVAGIFANEHIELGEDAVEVLVSPRRIAILVTEVPEAQSPTETAQRGPAAEAAFDDAGRPTKAAEGFARARGIGVDELEIREQNGRKFVFAVSRAEGRPAKELLPDICRRIVTDMYFPKNMRWGSRELRFSRPVRWLVALFGEEVVPFSVAGLTAGRSSRGHRWLGGPVEIAHPADYVEAMRSVKVMVDHRERESFIRSELERLAGERGVRLVDPMEKMSEVLHLVEWPTVLEGRFGQEHLRLPDEVLITAMQSHQRYFPLVGDEDELSNRFLFVMNGDPAFASAIVAGNERVLEGRIEDAEFSFDKDLATGIEAMAGQLDRVVFHDKIGTLADKTGRLHALVEYLAQAVGVPEETARRAAEAARLSKADQVSVMVREFADLEGTMGETYARMEGVHEDVAVALREQYLPEAAGGAVPKTKTGALLATAEKVDNIVAAFAVGEPPSGSKDPYGLRRAAMGMVTIAFYHGFAYDVERLVAFACDLLEGFPGLVPKEEVQVEATEFILERLARFLVDNGVARDSVEAVLPTSRVFADVRARAAALDAFRASARWEDLETAYSRPANLARKLDPADYGEVDADLFEQEAERALWDEFLAVAGDVDRLAAQEDYEAALERIASLRPAVDRYFDDVLVMAEDERLRINRLRVLDRIAGLVQELALLGGLQD
ncbi:MAG: glycine--tRNA ligase subunit beta [Thermoleophilia bacterium]